MLLRCEKKCFSLFIVLLFSAFCILLTVPSMVMAAKTAPDPALDTNFPLYPAIRPNVNFWIRIFTKVSKHQGLLHDTKNLNLIYGTIRLDGSQTRAARKKNRGIKKKAVKKYKSMLIRFAAGAAPSTREEKQILALFGDTPAPAALKRAAYNIRIQTGLKEEFKSGLIRSGAFISRFKKTFVAHGLPTDLTYLPCVESSFRTSAYSKFGAAGIWQFTRSTGRLFMDIDYVVDERRDPFIAAGAAARLLKKNYGKLKSWPLAITAYNHGLNGMMRARKSKGSYENIFKSYRSRSFKFASRNFYSEFLAARQVAKNHETYFGPLNFDLPRSYHVIHTKGYLSIDDVSAALNVSQKTLRRLNPALRKPVFNNQKFIPKGFDLKLPRALSKPKSETQLAALYRAKQKPSRFHRVQKGDTAGKVARTHSVSLNDLILANNLNRRATIYVGQNLRIPVKGEHIIAAKASAPKKKPAPAGKTQTKPDAAMKPSPPAVSAKAAPLPPTPEESPALEKPEKNKINPLVVTTNLKIDIAKAGNGIGTITVQAEETLGHYADWLGIKTRVIRKLNRFSFGKPIGIDQKIKLPLKGNLVQVFEEKRYEFHKELEEDFFEIFTIQGTEVYRVKPGDNIWSLCLNELEVPFWLLKKYNPDTRFQTLQPQQSIVYPLIGKRESG